MVLVVEEYEHCNILLRPFVCNTGGSHFQTEFSFQGLLHGLIHARPLQGYEALRAKVIQEPAIIEAYNIFIKEGGQFEQLSRHLMLLVARKSECLCAFLPFI